MNLQIATKNIFNDISDFLETITDDDYSKKLDIYSGSSIGMHIRHILEFYQCLFEQSATGLVNYDKRKRNPNIENSTEFAQLTIDELNQKIDLTDFSGSFKLEASYEHIKDDFITIESNLSRELVYNLEHAIHHLALIKIGFMMLKPEVKLPAHFGVAPSTIKFNNQEVCAH